MWTHCGGWTPPWPPPRTTESHYFILDRWFCEFLVLQVGLKHLVLGRRSHPEAKNRDVIALGTPATASAWARSQFKSGDGTFKMTVKSFYQEKHLRASLILIDFNSDLYSHRAARWCLRPVHHRHATRQEERELRRSLLADLGLLESAQSSHFQMFP